MNLFGAEHSLMEDMMICPECHRSNRKNAKFCKICGAMLEATCPACGYAYESGNHFCDQCGCNLETIKPPLHINYSRPDSYTPKFLADKILNSRSTIEGERKVVTILFADVANPSANHVYERIGYKPIINFDEYRFAQ